MLDISIDDDVKRALPPARWRQLRTEVARMVKAAARTEGRDDLEATLRLCGDAVIHELNRDYRKKNKPTDVLAFALREAEDAKLHPTLLGDIVISVETARRQAKRKGAAGLHAEVLFLASHGLCHLLGYDHNDDAEEHEMNTRMAALRAEAVRRGRIRAA
jgi:probable rRNA maturation factor